MNIFVCCSKAFYDKVPPIKAALEQAGHIITLPNSAENPTKEFEMKALGAKQHSQWKAGMLRLQKQKVEVNDAILVLNFDKASIANYIGGATFLEMYMAFEQGKPIYLYHPIPIGSLTDEMLSFEPIIINEDLAQIR